MKFQRIAAAFFIAFLLCLQCNFAVDFFDDNMQNQIEILGGDSLLEALPSETDLLLAELGLDEISLKAMLALTPREFFAVISRIAIEEIKKPMLIFSSISGVVLLCALLEGMRDISVNTELSSVFGVVSVLCVSAALSSPVIGCIEATANAIQTCAAFMLTLIPILTGIMITGGQPLSGATYNLFMFSACELAAQLTANFLIPMLGSYLAVCIVSSTMPSMNFAGIGDALKKTIVWTLGLVLALFIGLMSVQSFVANAGDTVTTKATKYLISNLVPVVGGAVSDAIMATQGCIKMLKTTLGGFGVLVSGAIFLPILLRTFIWYAVINFSCAIAEMLDIKQVSQLMKSFSSALAILISLLLCFSLMVITGTTIVLLLGVGT